ncbi:MAG: hypothetical protein WKF89_14125 [Chitinophagaceae bacterium]
MSIFKNILRPFVEFKEEPKEEPGTDYMAEPIKMNTSSVQEVGKTMTASTVASEPAKSTTYDANNAGSLKASTSPEYQKHFDDLIDEANAKNPLFEGTDLKEFIESKVDVEAIADEETRYKTAFNVLRRTGLTKERLVTTGKHYINIVENDLKGFESAYTQQYKTDVEQMEQAMQQKVLELKSLNDRIALLSEEITKTNEMVAKSKDRLNANKSAFMIAGENKKKELQAELEKINQYFL